MKKQAPMRARLWRKPSKFELQNACKAVIQNLGENTRQTIYERQGVQIGSKALLQGKSQHPSQSLSLMLRYTCSQAAPSSIRSGCG